MKLQAMLAKIQKVATVLTVYGIETAIIVPVIFFQALFVATVLTVYGIETRHPRQIHEYRVS